MWREQTFCWLTTGMSNLVKGNLRKINCCFSSWFWHCCTNNSNSGQTALLHRHPILDGPGSGQCGEQRRLWLGMRRLGGRHYGNWAGWTKTTLFWYGTPESAPIHDQIKLQNPEAQGQEKMVKLNKKIINLLYRSLSFANFVKSCLTKNPKKRPSPEKLLNVCFFKRFSIFSIHIFQTNPFVSGALSSRLTQMLLDRVNHPERIEHSPPVAQRQNGHRQHLPTDSESEQGLQ